MLSGETATGRYPVRSVEVLDAIIRDAESMTRAVGRPSPTISRTSITPAR